MSQSERFLGKDLKKCQFDKQFSEQMWYLSSIYIRRLFLNPYLSCVFVPTWRHSMFTPVYFPSNSKTKQNKTIYWLQF